MTNNTPSGAKKHRESTEPESHQTAKTFFFLLLLQTGWFKFAWLFHDGFRTKQQHFSLSSAPAHRFFPGLKSREAIRTAHWRTMASFRRHFSSRVRMRTNHLATKCNITQDCWIRNTVGVRECLKKAWSGQQFFSQYCIGSLWRQTCCTVIDDKLQLKHASAAKKVTWTNKKNIKNVTRCRDSRSAKSIETR